MHVILALNGTFPTSLAVPSGNPRRSIIVCADGAAGQLLALGISPSQIVGDFDSISEEDLQTLTAKGCTITKVPSAKDATDGELALEAALTHSPTHLDIIGLDGGRFDMVFFNLSLLMHPALEDIRTSCRLSDGSVGVLVTPGSASSIECRKNALVSLLPLTDEVHVSKFRGVDWELTEDKIYRSKARTVSNSASGLEPVSCSITSGRALLIWNP